MERNSSQERIAVWYRDEKYFLRFYIFEWSGSENYHAYCHYPAALSALRELIDDYSTVEP